MSEKPVDDPLSRWLIPIALCFLRGTMSSLPQVKPEYVLLAFMKVLGKVYGQLYCGDELAVFKFRKVCIESFSNAIKGEPVQVMPVEEKMETSALDGVSSKTAV